jgi:hypothetical protein
MQAPFQDYQVGVLTVPGGLVVAPTPDPMPAAPDQTWSTVKPPQVVGASKAIHGVTPAKSPAAPAPILTVTVGLVSAGVILLLVAAGIFRRFRRRSETASAPS